MQNSPGWRQSFGQCRGLRLEIGIYAERYHRRGRPIARGSRRKDGKWRGRSEVFSPAGAARWCTSAVPRAGLSGEGIMQQAFLPVTSLPNCRALPGIAVEREEVPAPGSTQGFPQKNRAQSTRLTSIR